MAWTQIIWDDSAGGNVEHIEQHGLTTDDVDFVLGNHESKGVSRSTGRPCVFGRTPDGHYILVVYEEVDDQTIVPVTAYEIAEP